MPSVKTMARPSGCTSTSRDTKSVSGALDRKSTRLNSSHANISHAVFCLKKKSPLYMLCPDHTSILKSFDHSVFTHRHAVAMLYFTLLSQRCILQVSYPRFQRSSVGYTTV